MSQKTTIKDEELFNIDFARKEAVCLLCSKKLTDLRKFSYHRHYKTIHRDFACQHGLLEDEKNESPGPSRKIAKVEVRMDQKTYISALAELVTVNGLPLNALKYPAFQRITRPIEDGLKMTRHLNPDSMKEVLKKIADQIRDKIKSEIEGKPVCLKADAVTRMEREFLGINIQFVDRKVIKIRTLAIIELYDRHTAENLTVEIIAILDIFGIEIGRLLTVTTDNASNMLATIIRLQHIQEATMNDFLGSVICGELIIQQAGEEIEEPEDDDEDNEDGENNTEERDENQPLDKLIEPILQGVRCAEHTLQLAVSDALKHANLKMPLIKVRKAVKTLRKLPYKRMFVMSNRHKPKLDCVTRWNSSFMMIESLLKEREFISSRTEDMEEKIIDEGLWTFIERFEAAFRPVADATTKLQDTQVTFGDFFLIWERCTFQLKATQDNLASLIASKMDIRRQKLMTNPSFLAAIYVDQRINFRNTPFMSNEERTVALEFIRKTWSTMKNLAGRSAPATNSTQTVSSNADDSFDVYLDSLDESNSSTQDTNMEEELANLARMPRLKLTNPETILDWWYKLKSSKPELYSLASTLLSIPCTQVSVERSFSGLALILTKHRTLLSEETLQNILVIRLNSELLKSVDFSKT